MDKPKFKLSKKEMLQFNDDCYEAASFCPQFKGWGYEDREILLGEVSAKELVKTWMECTTLFSSGYNKELSLEALEIFDEYKQYKAKKILYKTNKT